MPDLIALQEVTLWRTAPFSSRRPPPSCTINWTRSWRVGKAQPALRRPSRAVRVGCRGAGALRRHRSAPHRPGCHSRPARPAAIAVRSLNAQTHRYRAVFSFGNPILGRCRCRAGGWPWTLCQRVEVSLREHAFAVDDSGLPQAEQSSARKRMNSSPTCSSRAHRWCWPAISTPTRSRAGIHRARAQHVANAGFVDAWKFAHPADPGYTWPLFGEDQNGGPAMPNERIDLIFVGGPLQFWLGHTPAIVSAVRTGTTAPFASDHAGLAVKLELK